MGQNVAVEIVENAHFSPEIYGKHGLRPSFRARTSCGWQVEQDEPQVMVGKAETAQQYIFRHRKVPAITLAVEERARRTPRRGKRLAPCARLVAAAIYIFLDGTKKTRNPGLPGFQEVAGRNIQRRHIGGHGGAWHHPFFAAIEKGWKGSGKSLGRDNS